MKFFLKSWLAPMGVCGVLAFVAISGNRWVTAQPQAPEVPGTALVSDELGGDTGVPLLSKLPIINALFVTGHVDDDDDEDMEVDESEIVVEVDGMEDEDSEDPIEEGSVEEGDEEDAARGPDEDEGDRSDEFENRSEEIIHQIQEAKGNRDPNRVQELKQQLQAVTREHFEWLESKRQDQVKALEARLESLKQVLDARQQNAEQIIERRVKKLLGESDALDWNPKLDAKQSWRGQPARRGDEEARRVHDEAAELALKAARLRERELARLTERDLALDGSGRKALRGKLELSRLDALRAGQAELKERLSQVNVKELKALEAAKLDASLERADQAAIHQEHTKRLEAQRRALEEQKRVLSEQLEKVKKGTSNQEPGPARRR